MSKMKNMIIYLLSILIAFESGVMISFIHLYYAIKDTKNNNNQYNQRPKYTYYWNKKES